MMVIVTSISALLLITVLAGWLGWLHSVGNERNSQQMDLQRSDLLAMIRKKEEQIERANEDYKALVESYIRETGKIFIKPTVTEDKRLPAAQPSSFRMKPPDWANRDRGKQ